MLDEKLQDGVTTEGSTEKWTSFKETVSKTANEVFGVKTRTHEDWFDEKDEKIKEAIHAKDKSYMKRLSDPSSVSKREKFKALPTKVQTDLRAIQDQWWLDKAAAVQHYADTHNAKKSFSLLKTVFGLSASGSAPLLSSDGNTLSKDQKDLSKRWREYFSTLLNRPSSDDSETLNQIPQQPVRVSLAKPSTIEEINKAIHQTVSGRASGKDSIPSEIYKTAGPDALVAFHDVLLTVWEEMMPDDFCEALIVSLYKKKGSMSDCWNYRGISFLSVAGKIFGVSHPQQTHHHSIRTDPPWGTV